MTSAAIGRRTGGFANVFRTVKERDVLVEGEVVFYKESPHWAKSGVPAATNAVLIFCLAIIALRLVPETQWGFIFTGFAFIFTASRVYNRFKDWSKAALYTLGVVAFLTFTSVGFNSVAVSAIFVLLLLTVLQIFDALFHQTIYLTDRRLIMAESFRYRKVSTVALGRITDVSFEISTLGGFLDYSHFKVETAGQDQALADVNFIKYGQDFYDTLIKMSTNRTDFDDFYEIAD